jgi:hypothetical protein
MEIDRPGESRSRARRVVLLIALGVAGLSMMMAWSAMSLSGLPDVGDPFDIEAFVAPKVDDADNAYVLYKEAVARLTKDRPEFTYEWPTAGPAERRWLEENRPAMELWRRGTERPEAEYVSPRNFTVETQLPIVQELRGFLRLAKLEGSRLEELGDLEGAWRWYRAIFRTGRHVGRRSSMIERFVGIAFHSAATGRMTRWAADPRVDATMLRRALDAAIADDGMTGPLTDNLKVEYLAFANTYSDPELMIKCMLDDDLSRVNLSSPLGRIPSVMRLQRVVMKEPERSRRVLRLVFANLLTWSDLPKGRRPPVAFTIPNPNSASTVKSLVDLRAVDASAPDSARALPPDELARWFESTLYARHLMPSFSTMDAACQRERAAQAGLLLTLANELYAREHGHPPETVEELVGPYLKSLPEAYTPPN